MNSLVMLLRQQRTRIWEQAKAILDAAQKANRRLTPEEGRKFDSLDTEIESLGKDIERAERGEGRGRELSAPLRVIPRPLLDGQRVDNNPAVWRTADGRRVRVLEPGDSMQQYMREQRGEFGLVSVSGESGESGDYDGLGFGEFCRAMVLGATSEIERRALSEGTDSAGGFSVPDILASNLIDRLRAQAAVFRAGAKTVPLESDITNIARIATDPVPAWRAENAVIAESDPTFERVQFTARALAVLIRVSRELLEDSVNINEALQTVFAEALAGELDRVALVGSGTAPEPRGIRNTTGVNEVSMGVNGGPLVAWDNVLDVLKLILEDNARDVTAMVLAPRSFIAQQKKKDGNGNPLTIPSAIAAIPQLVSTRIPITETQGTATDASHITMGHFPDMFVGIRNSLRVEVLKERYAEVLQYGFVAWLRADIQLAHPESFGRLIGIIP